MSKITKAKITSGILSFTSNREKLQAQGHEIAMLIFQHTAPKEVGPDCNGTGDCSQFVDLIKAMPTSWGNQMLAWMKAFSPMRVNLSTAKYGYSPEYHKLDTPEAKLAAWNLEGANTNPFYSYEKEVAVRDDSFTVEKIMAVIKREISKGQKAKEEGKIPTNQVSAVAAALKMLEAIDLKPLIPAASNTDNADKAVA